MAVFPCLPGLGILTVHQFTNIANIYIYRAKTDAPATADAHNSVFILVRKIFQFMHESLADPHNLGPSGVMSGTVMRE